MFWNDSNSSSENTANKSRKRKLDDIAMSSANDGPSTEKKNPSTSSDLVDIDTDTNEYTELVQLTEQQQRDIDNEYSLFYSEQLNKVHNILVQVRPSTAMKYCMDLKKLIAEMKKRAEVALQIKETKIANVQHAFNVKQQMIKQNFKHNKGLKYEDTMDNLENQMLILEKARNEHENPNVNQ